MSNQDIFTPLSMEEKFSALTLSKRNQWRVESNPDAKQLKTMAK